MALLVVPYNNGMQVGQGFNSYTQSICLDRAVVYTGPDGATAAGSKDVDIEKLPQIVTYSSHFIDKLSDVVKALNVSAALSIKTGTVTGSGSGSYLDEDKIKESDINFLINVKVTNQRTTPTGEAQFNAIDGLDRSKFTDVYGDTFISGFLEGGEFVGMVSMKVKDTSKIEDIKAQLEVSLTQVQGKGAVSFTDSNVAKDAETSITVNWSGGGKIKDPETKWDIDTMLQVAARFPSLVAKCPQRTSAILTKYQNLYSFLKVSAQFDTLSYDNAGVYTADLLDDYMDYKVHWKNIRLLLDDATGYQKSTDKDAYDATPTGLDLARREVLKQMVLIVNEVDAVRLNPKHAQDAVLQGNTVYLNPSVFQARLPVKAPPAPPIVPTSAPNKPDPKAWMWVKIPGTDSPGRDYYNAGTTDPEELMRKAYEYETAHPGQFVKCFNTSGWLKASLLQVTQLSKAPCDLYIRVQINDQWDFIPGVDSGGNDVPVAGVPTTGNDAQDQDIVDILTKVTPRNDIVAFNSFGWTKTKVVKPYNRCSRQAPYIGLWVRKSYTG